ncbi:Protein of unknown function, partial [Gryllus bimaculatus]
MNQDLHGVCDANVIAEENTQDFEHCSTFGECDSTMTDISYSNVTTSRSLSEYYLAEDDSDQSFLALRSSSTPHLCADPGARRLRLSDFIHLNCDDLSPDLLYLDQWDLKAAKSCLLSPWLEKSGSCIS